ncbi:hypothetical protein EVAR_78961_1 [Eumeta japonica]|uniref:Uncharacterized protein n=1 Tax=Eumeta variegata TaxID=151549 RepID=A0A4C1UTA7_EUMVA|nr:hypothetical protein EVAR_78961_1 [Eumeta japonica]
MPMRVLAISQEAVSYRPGIDRDADTYAPATTGRAPRAPAPPPFAPPRESRRKVQNLAVERPPTRVPRGALSRVIHHSDPPATDTRHSSKQMNNIEADASTPPPPAPSPRPRRSSAAVRSAADRGGGAGGAPVKYNSIIFHKSLLTTELYSILSYTNIKLYYF